MVTKNLILPGMKLSIGIIGDYNANFEPHPVTNRMFAQAAQACGVEIAPEWVATDRVTQRTLEKFDALWISPGSPYRNLDGALGAIEFARRHQVPLGGACAGFQHVVLEYARNVLGLRDAVHAEYDPPAGSRQVMVRLPCSLAGKELIVNLAPNSRAAKIYGSSKVVERYYCSFGLNPEYRDKLGDLTVSGLDDSGEARVVELPSHPFFLATLFVPGSTSPAPHPIATALLSVGLDRTRSGLRAGSSVCQPVR